MLKLDPRIGAPLATSKTLADVIIAVDDIQHLSKGRCCDLKTACRTIARMMDRSPAGIAVDLAMIRDALEDTIPAQHGLTEKRWSSIRSDFLGALRLTGIAEPLANLEGCRVGALALVPTGRGEPGLPDWSVALCPILQSQRHRTGAGE